ncbi:helix-turn-helix protein [Thermosporothrix hazakensis]|jgi:transcriptional regulator with XRE-family HTH domain|uniref:Helix-turn-helix protein n=1 Tax=Thermosporothrix hazakensis TaxID=644383 RepID=A0A326TYS7_THEHA|nr:helix-turn-helix transcriptional regulator [Thermosporothrix hazakensis]PZW22409.1 helix-turn-helix protein [Thermosporothrix hazakensis]GCE49163.1 hypothetical protein KTH_40320 [Thermosporothrix hazakensis]
MEPNHKLKYEREKRGWSQAYVARKIGTSADLISKWERGLRGVGMQHRQALCDLFNRNAEELGFIQPITSLIKELGNEASLDKDDPMNKGRRQLLQQALTLLCSGGLATPNHISIPTDLYITLSDTALRECWHQINNNTSQASEILSVIAPMLINMALEPSPYQQQLASIATKTLLLRVIAATHKANYIARELFNHEAIQCSRLSNDHLLQAAALTYMGWTYLVCPPVRPEKAIEVAKEALTANRSEKTNIASNCHAIMAEAYSYLGADYKQTALRHMGLAQESYANTTDVLDYADCTPYTLHHNAAMAYLHLGDPKTAIQQLDKSLLQNATPRGQCGSLLYIADAACKINDYDLFKTRFIQGIELVETIHSDHRKALAKQIANRAPKDWLRDDELQKAITKLHV